jgi:hypothetical protein
MVLSSQIGSSHPPELLEEPLRPGSQEFRRTASNESVEKRRLEPWESLRPKLTDPSESFRSDPVEPIESLRRGWLTESLRKEPIEEPRESFRRIDGKADGWKSTSLRGGDRGKPKESRRRCATDELRAGIDSRRGPTDSRPLCSTLPSDPLRSP